MDMTAKGALYSAISFEAWEVILADPTSMGVFLVEKSYSHLIARTRVVSTAAIEGDNIIRTRTVMVLVEIAGIVYFLRFFSGPTIQKSREIEAISQIKSYLSGMFWRPDKFY